MLTAAVPRPAPHRPRGRAAAPHRPLGRAAAPNHPSPPSAPGQAAAGSRTTPSKENTR